MIEMIARIALRSTVGIRFGMAFDLYSLSDQRVYGLDFYWMVFAYNHHDSDHRLDLAVDPGKNLIPESIHKVHKSGKLAFD